MKFRLFLLLFPCLFFSCKGKKDLISAEKPNVILIYTDDLGVGDLSIYGGKIPTPNIDKLADNGILHTNAYSTASTCTPSRYSLLTGEYAWRKQGRGVVNADASALIPKGSQTVASLFKKAGYQTAVVGKWHLGLGDENGIDWNGKIQNTPNDIGFDYSFIMPATSDRVPCVYLENKRVLNLLPQDTLAIDYHKKIGNFPTGKENPEALKLKYSHGHDMTIINGISRIGFQAGGSSATWKDENIADDFVFQSKKFISENKNRPFFLYLATNNIHVPRMPHPRFQGKSGFGFRGDAILELDFMVEEIVKTLSDLKLEEKTLIIFSSDNGAVLDDGYQDQAVELVGNHEPSAGFRGGKYSTYQGGTHIPFIVSWKGKLSKKVSFADVSQVDLIGSMGYLLNVDYDRKQAIDTQNQLLVWLGLKNEGRKEVVQEAISRVISVVSQGYKYIEPTLDKRQTAWQTGIETGFSAQPQLYDLRNDPKERNNIAEKNPKKLKELQDLLKAIKAKN